MLHYHRTTEMLYIRFQSEPSTESEEVSPGVVFDFNAKNQVVGIEIEDASHKVDLTRLEFISFPLENLVLNPTAPVIS